MNELERSLAFRDDADDLAVVKALPSDRLPTISVVVPSYNQGRFIAQTLDSIVSQNYPHLEIFVADGGSQDNTVAILNDYAVRFPTVLRFVSEPDGGHLHGVNKAILSTRGEVVAWINSDDVYLPDAFWRVAAFFHFNRSAHIVYGRNRYVDEDLSPITDYPVDWSPLIIEQQRRMMHFCLVPQPSLFFRRTAVTLCGALSHKILDYELWLRWQRNLPFYFYDAELSLSRVHKDAISVRAERKLLSDIADVVHLYYGVVPYSWALRYQYNLSYGAAWSRGENPPVTSAIKIRAWLTWFGWNLAKAPRALSSAAVNTLALWKQSLRASA